MFGNDRLERAAGTAAFGSMVTGIFVFGSAYAVVKWTSQKLAATARAHVPNVHLPRIPGGVS